MAGLADRTDYHWGHMFKAALISTLLGVGAELGADDDDRLVRAIRSGSQDSIGQTGRQIVERQLAIPPTITIRPGFAFRSSEERRVGKGWGSKVRMGWAEEQQQKNK